MMAGDRDNALHQCRLAVQYDYPNLDQVETDEDLAPLHDDPEFKKLFEK